MLTCWQDVHFQRNVWQIQEKRPSWNFGTSAFVEGVCACGCKQGACEIQWSNCEWGTGQQYYYTACLFNLSFWLFNLSVLRVLSRGEADTFGPTCICITNRRISDLRQRREEKTWPLYDLTVRGWVASLGSELQSPVAYALSAHPEEPVQT